MSEYLSGRRHLARWGFGVPGGSGVTGGTPGGPKLLEKQPVRNILKVIRRTNVCNITLLRFLLLILLLSLLWQYLDNKHKFQSLCQRFRFLQWNSCIGNTSSRREFGVLLAYKAIKGDFYQAGIYVDLNCPGR